MTRFMHKISCTIISLNEAHCIGRTLDAARKVADEIIVIDSGSTDDTIAIAKSKGAKVIHNDWIGFGPQKRFASDKAKHDWILNLDADEVLTPELVQEIDDWKTAGQPTPLGFRLRLVTVYPNKTKPRFRADFHNYIRLYDRRVMRFRDSLTHDEVVPKNADVGQLASPCYHYSIRSLEHLKMKHERYTDLQSKELKKPFLLMLIRWPFEYPIAFLKYYIARGHIFGGLFGLRISLLAARYRGRRIGKLIRAHNHAKRKS